MLSKLYAAIIINIIKIVFITQYKTKQHHKLQSNLDSAEIKKNKCEICSIEVIRLHHHVGVQVAFNKTTISFFRNKYRSQM